MAIARLDDRAVVRVAGPDAAALLQNVLTLDVPAADRHGSGYGALLTPQGKILWDLILHKAAEGYFVDLRADQVEAFAKRLSLYKLRAKVEIAAAPDMAVFVEWSEPAESGPRDSSASPSPQGGRGRPADPRLPALGRRWVAPAGSVATDASTADWHRHRIALAVPEGGLDFVFGDTFPHDAAMDSLNGIDFSKGCYIGQEVVSRMRHRGTARRRIVAVRANGPLPEPGTEIAAGEMPIGRLGSSAEGHGIGLVRLDRLRAALDAGLSVRAGAGEVTVALPAWATYGWPAAPAAGEA
jgi:folate-binding protein YgfZ